MNRFDQNWQKLVALARQAPPVDSEPVMLPPGFSTRVAALAVTMPVAPWSGLERFALRGFVAATACCAAAVAYSYFGRAPDPMEDPALDETLHAMLDLS